MALFVDNYDNLLECKEVVNTVTNVTVSDVYLGILSYYISYAVSDVEIVKVCNLINFALGKSIFPQTTYLFNKQFQHNYGAVKYTFVCSNCYHTLETKLFLELEDTNNVACVSCGTINEQKLSNEHYFVSFDIKQQIKALFSKRDVQEYFKRPNQDGIISDAYDGELYIELSQSNEPFLSYNFNIDSAPLFNNSAIKLTPILLVINELPLSVRNQNVIVAGFWCNTVPVNYSLFLEHFANSTIELDEDGMLLSTRNDLVIEVKIKPLCAPLDSVARAPSMNMDQFNAYESCFKCDINGEYIERSMRFPLGEELPRLRTEESFLEAAELAVTTNTVVNGIKGYTPLALNRSFKCVKGFPVEYLHAGILGVVRQFTNAWVTGDGNARAEFYIGSPAKLYAAKEILKKFKLPSEVNDFVYDLKKRSLWKGSNWRDFLLYMSPSLVSELLPEQYANNWLLFVKGIYLLMTDNITDDTLREAHRLFIDFNRGVQQLYGPKFMTYNVHLLIHLPDTVKQCGPLFVCSAFPFESFLHILKNMVHAYKGAAQQLVKKILLRNNLLMFINTHNLSETTMKFLKTFPIKLKTAGDVVNYVNLNDYRPNNIENGIIVSNRFLRNHHLNFCRSIHIGSFYLKASLNNLMNDIVNSVVVDLNGNYFKIRSIFYITNHPTRDHFYFVAQNISVSNINNNFLTHIKQFNALTNNYNILSLNDIKCKCMYVNTGREQQIIEILSCHEAD